MIGAPWLGIHKTEIIGRKGPMPVIQLKQFSVRGV